MKKRKFGVRAKLLAFILPVVALEFFALIMIVNVYSRNMLEQKTTRWEPEGDAREGSWYVDGVSHATMAFGEPYMDTYTGNYVVTASQWVDRVGGKGMVVAADVTLDVLSEGVNNMEVEGNGRSVLYKDMGKNSGR